MSSALNILCIDSSTEACSVAILTKQQTIHQQFMLAPREHTQKILPIVDEVVKTAQLTLKDIDYIAYGQGPGSFTGVRIGISIAQGLAFGLDVEMVGVSTLQAMAQQAYNNQACECVYAAIDARMGEVYYAKFVTVNEVMTLVGEEIVIKPEQLIEQINEQDISEDSVLVGTGWNAYSELLAHYSNAILSDILYPNAEFMLTVAQQLIKDKQALAPELARPVYLRDTVTWKKLPGRE